MVFLASIGERGLRLIVTWLLSTALGAELFGSYTFAVTIATIITVFSPLGIDSGAVYFGAQYQKQKQWGRQKGLILSGAWITILSGVICSGSLWLSAPLLFEDPNPIQWIAPTILFLTPLMFIVGLLRSIKDMKGNAMVFQLSIPIGLLIGAIAIYVGSLSLEHALSFYWIALAISLIFGLWWARRRLSSRLYDPRITPSYHTKELLQYSLPQSLAAMVFRLTIWMDIIMLGWLSSNDELGIYRIASALAVIGALPISALSTIFNPIIAELVSVKDHVRLNTILKTITRWLLSVSFPVLIAMFLLPDLMLSLFSTEYQAGHIPLQILIGGQFVWISCAMAMRLIPMSGHSTLTLINGVIAAVLNIGLNYYFIPRYGAQGAAISTSLTLGLWSLWRLVEIWYLLKCFPFSKFNTGLFISGVGLALLSHNLIADLSLFVRTPIVFVMSIIFLLVAFRWGKEESDEEIAKKIRSKWTRLFSRRNA
ncbi:MAG: flippase [Myxococcota bacterium]|nr:flippase [Myxococcota bacterium]